MILQRINAAAHLGRQRDILIVDDSTVARAAIGRMIAGSGRFAIAGSVPDAKAALAFLHHHQVDAILLDIAMPGVDGLTALPDLLTAGRGAKVLVVSSSADDGGAAAIQALTLGAADTLVKPGAGTFAGRFADALIDKLDRLLADEQTVVAQQPTRPPRTSAAGFDVVAIGASTGGIHALSRVLREIPVSFVSPILITQHLPDSFMPYFAAQVAVLAGRPCDIASDRLRIRPGRVIVAPGDAHMRVVALGDGGAAVRLVGDPVPNGCMPSVDPMFESVSEVFGAKALAVVLSGMGRDGSEGVKRILAARGRVLVQDQDSSVVWGMPGTIAGNGDASAILPPDEIGRMIASGRRPA